MILVISGIIVKIYFLGSFPGTIRGDYATTVSHNIIHGSDSLASAEREIALFFGEDLV
ncbi:nucleoside-diphosphate kinase [Lysinibacillus sphaericus]|uniref:Nucleoside diphosphate kinase 6 n=1 Tax=Lysinibacillus sphaericus (strain C3-41) TaxID=444177 RepID=B1HTC6_LYSSC|nr:nucleoside diphosphate kinase [Lysinibacillus sphaericus C3-41]AMO34295.1 nucleoside-diphosphate kinase [Lysinibacillus sphaericus]MBG9727367.1 nucleoside diphosphate kinase [Lysinibacillus fusiformis]MBG9712185.1 nucleoside diphosphate kinase [Lysinibacillus sphaericus]MBG9732602.1 nucleoside diphosphate kinase [Lysinibacillus sphaericus]